MHLAFLHGEQVIIGLLVAGAIILAGLPLLLYIWLWYSNLSELKLALIYFVSVSALCAVSGFIPYDRGSAFSLMVFSFSFILTLPCSALAGEVFSEMMKARDSVLGDSAFAVVMLFCAGVNAVILYFIAVKMRRSIQ